MPRDTKSRSRDHRSTRARETQRSLSTLGREQACTGHNSKCAGSSTPAKKTRIVTLVAYLLLRGQHAEASDDGAQGRDGPDGRLQEVGRGDRRGRVGPDRDEGAHEPRPQRRVLRGEHPHRRRVHQVVRPHDAHDELAAHLVLGLLERHGGQPQVLDGRGVPRLSRRLRGQVRPVQAHPVPHDRQEVRQVPQDEQVARDRRGRRVHVAAPLDVPARPPPQQEAHRRREERQGQGGARRLLLARREGGLREHQEHVRVQVLRPRDGRGEDDAAEDGRGRRAYVRRRLDRGRDGHQHVGRAPALQRAGRVRGGGRPRDPLGELQEARGLQGPERAHRRRGRVGLRHLQRDRRRGRQGRHRDPRQARPPHPAQAGRRPRDRPQHEPLPVRRRAHARRSRPPRAKPNPPLPLPPPSEPPPAVVPDATPLAALVPPTPGTPTRTSSATGSAGRTSTRRSSSRSTARSTSRSPSARSCRRLASSTSRRAPRRSPSSAARTRASSRRW